MIALVFLRWDSCHHLTKTYMQTLHNEPPESRVIRLMESLEEKIRLMANTGDVITEGIKLSNDRGRGGWSRKLAFAEQDKEIAKLSKEGFSGRILAKKFGISQSLVFRILKEQGMDLNMGRKAKIRTEQVARLRKQGLKTKEIADKLGIAASTVNLKLREAGLTKIRNT